jgi:hypothetical protein
MTFLPSHRVLSLLALTLALNAGAHAGLLDDSIALDAVYIPALSLTTAAQGGDAAVAAKARTSMQTLSARWPALRTALLNDLADRKTPSVEAKRTLAAVDAHITAGNKAVAAADFKAAHEALEEVRIVLMKARVERGEDYFVDRLTAYHEPMEVLALAGSTWKPADLTPARRAELEMAFVQARALWRDIERHPPEAKTYGLSPARATQLAKGMADEGAALSRLSDALRGSDAAGLLKAAAAIKPPFARTFTAFGQFD